MKHRLALPLLTAAALTLAGCGSSTPDAPSAGAGSESPSASSASPASDLSGDITVLAAASLTETFTSLAKDFEAEHPNVSIKLSFGSSSTLAQQIAQGAPADLYASAGTKALDLLPEAAKSAPTVTIAKNVLEIATPAGNPKQVTGLDSLADTGLNVVLCAETVPCGAAADGVLKKAGVNAHVVSREIDVKATLAKITLGEADAAIVYHSDVVSAGDKVTGVEIPTEQNTSLDYPLVTLTSGPAVTAFADFIAGPHGLKALTGAGLLAP